MSSCKRKITVLYFYLFNLWSDTMIIEILQHSLIRQEYTIFTTVVFDPPNFTSKRNETPTIRSNRQSNFSNIRFPLTVTQITSLTMTNQIYNLTIIYEFLVIDINKFIIYIEADEVRSSIVSYCVCEHDCDWLY